MVHVMCIKGDMLYIYLPALGPRNDLWVVVVTISQKAKGETCSPVATRPEICAWKTRKVTVTITREWD